MKGLIPMFSFALKVAAWLLRLAVVAAVMFALRSQGWWVVPVGASTLLLLFMIQAAIISAVREASRTIDGSVDL